MRTVPLSELAEFVNGVAFRPEDWHRVGLPIIRIQNLTDSNKPINLTTRQVADKYKVRRGDLLVSWSATLGVYTWDRSDEALVNQHIFRVIPRTTVVDPRYLRHILDGALVSMERHLHGATMKHVNRGQFLATEVPLPPLDEQCRIAAILDCADALRSTRSVLIERLRDLKQAIFHEMFGDPITNGRNWSRVPLAQLVSGITSGESPNCEARPAEADEWAVLKLSAVSNGYFNAAENKAYLGDPALIRKVEVKSGDILFSRKNTMELVGAVAVVDDVPPRRLLPDLIFRLDLIRDSVEADYLHALLTNSRKRSQIVALASGSAGSMPNISKARLMGLQVETPPIELQRRYSSTIRRLNDMRLLHTQHQRVLDALFSSLQFRAFSGQL